MKVEAGLRMAAPDGARPLEGPRKSPRGVGLLCKGAASLAFFLILFRFIEASDFLSTVRNVNPKFFLLSLAISVTMIFISCLKWKILLDLQGKPIPLLTLVRYYYIGYYFSNLLPSNIGGDVARAYYAGRYIGSQGHAAASVLMERVTGLFLLLALAILAPAGITGLFSHAGIILPSLLAGLLLLFLGALLMVRPSWQAIGCRLHTILDFLMSVPGGRSLRNRQGIRVSLDGALRSGERLQGKIGTLATILRQDRGAFLGVALISALFYFFASVNVYVAFLAFGVDADLLAIAAVVPTAMLVSMIPISLGSLGLTEGAYVFYLGLIGINPAASLAMALLLRFKMLCNGLLGLLLSNRRISPWQRHD